MTAATPPISSAPQVILDDAAVWRLADMDTRIEAIRTALRTQVDGRLVAPPRHAVGFGNGDLVFTIGDTRDGGVAGFRVYDTFRSGSPQQTQLVAVWDTSTGTLRGLILGEAVGALRTGAIGGVAIDLMAKQDAATCGVLGTGLQARTQLMAALAMRPGIESVHVYSRNPEHRVAFARRLSAELGRDITPVDTARDAVRNADVLLAATNSMQPVLEPDWLKAGVHVNTVGPKFADRHELPPAIGTLASWVATDAPEQIRRYPGGHFLAGSPAWDRMHDLAALLDHAPARHPNDITLFCSAGLAGTEIILADALLHRAEQERAADARC